MMVSEVQPFLSTSSHEERNLYKVMASYRHDKLQYLPLSDHGCNNYNVLLGGLHLEGCLSLYT